MKRIRKNGNFFLCLFINMIFNLGGTIPAWILLVLHYVLGWSVKWFWLALAIWLIVILLRMEIISWAARCGNTPDAPRENKNPYSVKQTDGGKV